ncbi:MAG: ArgR family transcriptional regulator [Bacteroidales bacterium]|jgi:transcriptional regulator of arginine metabolism|nr:ArgR family transcriptional regulator [Bacteroidales bacterium]
MQNTTKIRQQAILEIIQAGPVYSQEELALRLKEAGISSTQATLSRDLNALRISKIPGEGYVVPVRHRPLTADLSSGVLRIQFSDHLAVLKTRPGLASAVAALIDAQSILPIIGTIAGDDTILLVGRVDATQADILDALTPIIPAIKDRVVI